MLLFCGVVGCGASDQRSWRGGIGGVGCVLGGGGGGGGGVGIGVHGLFGDGDVGDVKGVGIGVGGFPGGVP